MASITCYKNLTRHNFPILQIPDTIWYLISKCKGLFISSLVHWLRFKVRESRDTSNDDYILKLSSCIWSQSSKWLSSFFSVSLFYGRKLKAKINGFFLIKSVTSRGYIAYMILFHRPSHITTITGYASLTHSIHARSHSLSFCFTVFFNLFLALFDRLLFLIFS